MDYNSPELKAYFAQSRAGYRPGKRSVWNGKHWQPGPKSSEHERADYRAWLAGERTPGQERKSIIDRMLAAEFGFKPHTTRPVTPPEHWSEYLGESLPAKYLDRAAAVWQAEGTDNS